MAKLLAVLQNDNDNDRWLGLFYSSGRPARLQLIGLQLNFNYLVRFSTIIFYAYFVSIFFCKYYSSRFHFCCCQIANYRVGKQIALLSTRVYCQQGDVHIFGFYERKSWKQKRL